MKKQVMILWISFVVCVLATVGLWFMVNKSNPDYEEVKVVVLSAKTTQIKNKKNGSTYNKYDVEVEYKGKTYNLENAHSANPAMKGRSITAYYANDKMYADVQGVKNGTPVGKLYFVCLIGSFILLFVATIQTSKLSQMKKENA